MSHNYVIRDNVPVLDEHVFYGNDGEPVFRIDEAKLKKIIKNNNRRIQETGDEVPLIIGHTDDDSGEADQPEIVGYADNFRLARLFNTKRKAILARFKLFKDKAKEVLRKFPRRSVELWVRKMEIDPISLLGASTPERSLGLLRHAADGVHYSHTLETEQSVDNVEEIVGRVLEELKQTDVWKLMEEIAHQQERPEEEEVPLEEWDVPPENENPEGYEDEEGEGEIPDEPEHYEAGAETVRRGMSILKQAIPHKSKSKVHYEADLEDEPEHYEASGTNTSIPRMKMSRDALRSQRDQLRIRLRRQEAETAQTKKALESFRLKFRRAEREKDLVQLEAEGLLFDRSEELEFGLRMNDKQWATHTDKMRKRYQRAPLDGTADEVVRYSRSGNTTSKTRSREDMEGIVRLAEAKGLSYDEAAEQYQSKTEKVF